MATFEQEKIKEIVGEDKYHELLMEIGGFQMSLPRPKADTVVYLSNKGFEMKQIVMKTRLTERYVREVLNRERMRSRQLRMEI